MKIHYDDKIDLLYIRLDESEQQIVNKRVTGDIVLDMLEQIELLELKFWMLPNIST